jgi:mRNA-degrading endonuclease HigB of HigAB toxin-antitoxin module
MVIEILATKAFIQALKRHPHADIVNNKIQLLANTPRPPFHPSLKVHPLHRIKERNICDCSITDSERLLFEIKNNTLRLWNLVAMKL